MAAATDIILAAHRLIGLIRSGQSAAATEINDSFIALNHIIDNWNTERLNIFSIGSASYPLVSGTQTYAIGPGAAFNAPRPVKIVSANIEFPNSGGVGNLSYPLELMDETQWRMIRERGAQNDVPRKMYCDYAVPSSTIYLWPVPTFAAVTVYLELQTWTLLQAFPDLTTNINLSTGYLRALEYALAIEVAPRFGLSVVGAVSQIADESKAAIRALNGAPPPAETAAAPLNATPSGATPKQ